MIDCKVYDKLLYIIKLYNLEFLRESIDEAHNFSFLLNGSFITEKNKSIYKISCNDFSVEETTILNLFVKKCVYGYCLGSYSKTLHYYNSNNEKEFHGANYNKPFNNDYIWLDFRWKDEILL